MPKLHFKGFSAFVKIRYIYICTYNLDRKCWISTCIQVSSEYGEYVLHDRELKNIAGVNYKTCHRVQYYSRFCSCYPKMSTDLQLHVALYNSTNTHV